MAREQRVEIIITAGLRDARYTAHCVQFHSAPSRAGALPRGVKFKSDAAAQARWWPVGREESTTMPNATQSTDQDVMTLEEAAEYLKCHPVTLKRRAVVLRIPHKRLGSLWRFYRPALESWMRGDEDIAA